MSLNSLLKSFFVLFFFVIQFGFSQEKKSTFQLQKIGFMYNNARQKNILINDKDYFYLTNTFKAQFFFTLASKENWAFLLVAQPQIQHIQHQLLNEQFVRPSDPNYIEKRQQFTTRRDMTMAAFEVGGFFSFTLFAKLKAEINAGLGVAYIDNNSERLARGFTFLENISLGLSHRIAKSEIYIGTNLGHVSNLDIQLPNSGYNILGLEVSYRYYLQ